MDFNTAISTWRNKSLKYILPKNVPIIEKILLTSNVFFVQFISEIVWLKDFASLHDSLHDQTDPRSSIDRASETVDTGLIPDLIKAKIRKIGIHSFPAWRSAIKVQQEGSNVCVR